jgi:hypothetical protein
MIHSSSFFFFELVSSEAIGTYLACGCSSATKSSWKGFCPEIITLLDY